MAYFHEKQILEIIEKFHPEGISQKDIIKKTKPGPPSQTSPLSRQTVYTTLKRLIKKDKVRKIGTKYYVVDDYINSWRIYAEFLKTKMKENILATTIMNIDGNASEAILSGQNSLAKPIFDFANLVGSFILYLFVEAMEAFDDPMSKEISRKITPEKQVELALFFISKALPTVEELFSSFLERFDPNKNANLTKGLTYQSMLETLLNVYPDLRNLSKDYLDKTIRRLAYQTTFALTHSDCTHRWEEVAFHKLGSLYLCPMCHKLALYPVVDKEKRNQMATDDIMQYLEDMQTKIRRKYLQK